MYLDSSVFPSPTVDIPLSLGCLGQNETKFSLQSIDVEMFYTDIAARLP
jgi:hypothetical protein